MRNRDSHASRRAAAIATVGALVVVLSLGLGLGAAGAKKKGKGKKRKPVPTLIVLNETPALSGVVYGRHRCDERRYIEIRRFGNDALVGSVTSNRDGRFKAEGTYSGPAYAYSQPGPRGKKWKCRYGLSGMTGIGLADLEIAQAALPPSPETGGHPAYDVAVTNTGPDTAQEIVVTVEPEPQQLLGTFELDEGSSSAGCSSDGDVIRCRRFAARPGQPIVFRVAIACTGTTTSLADTARVSSSARDPDPADNETTGDLISCS